MKIPTNCDCGSTAGCPVCMPENYVHVLGPVQQWGKSTQRTGWICPRCKAVNSPDNFQCLNKFGQTCPPHDEIPAAADVGNITPDYRNGFLRESNT